MNHSIRLFLFLLGLTFLVGCLKDDDDGTAPLRNLPVFTIASEVTFEEGDENQNVTLAVTLSGENTANAIVNFTVLPKTAEATLDFKVITTGKLIFAPGETSKEIAIQIVGDELIEGNEEFDVVLYNPVNALLDQSTAKVTIKDDDTGNTGELIIPTTGYTTPTSYPGFNLTWADEFNGTTLDAAAWNYELGDGCPGNCGWGNNELQYYRNENTFLKDGNLVIEARKQNFGGYQYTSSRLTTQGKKQFKYGRIDIRAALPEGQGLWPALWMLGSSVTQNGWPACGEVDIMELTGNLPGRVLGTVHFGANLSQHQYVSGTRTLPGNAKFSQEFHVFSLNWRENQIQFLVDDVPFHNITPASMNGQPYPFNNFFFFIFNVAVGGNFPGSPDGTTAFPQRMIVDYIRVFQLQ